MRRVFIAQSRARQNARVGERLLLVGSLLASLSAVAAFVLGVTRTARLRRREQTLRESMTMFEPGGDHRHLLADLHKATVAELVGRHLTSPWRAVWPWLAWLAVIVMSGQMGYYAADYLGGTEEFSWAGFATALAGEPTAAILSLGALPWLASLIFLSQFYTLTGREQVVRSFYDGQSIGRPETYTEAMSRLQLEAVMSPEGAAPKPSRRERRQAGAYLALSLAPGAFATFLGLMVGMMTWLTRADQDQLEPGALHPLGYVVVPGLLLSSMATMYVISEVRAELNRLALPAVHATKSGLVLTAHRPRRRPPSGATR